MTPLYEVACIGAIHNYSIKQVEKILIMYVLLGSDTPIIIIFSY